MSLVKSKDMSKRKLYTAREIADMYGFSVDKVYKMGKDGTLKTIWFGNSVRFYPIDEVEQ